MFSVFFIVLSDVNQAYVLELRNPDPAFARQLQQALDIEAAATWYGKTCLPKRVALVIFSCRRRDGCAGLALFGDLVHHLNVATVRRLRDTGASLVSHACWMLQEM